MRYGIREIANVVLKAKEVSTFGRLTLKPGQPVMYFDTLKTSSLEGAVETVYARGGRGNPRLVAWDGNRELTFTMEDALLSPESFSILSGAGFLDASEDNVAYVHMNEKVAVDKEGTFKTDNKNAIAIPGKANANLADGKTASASASIYAMLVSDGIINPQGFTAEISGGLTASTDAEQTYTSTDLATEYATQKDARIAKLLADEGLAEGDEGYDDRKAEITAAMTDWEMVVMLDYYVIMKENVKQISIEAGKFGGSYYLEADTLWRDQATGKDYPAEFIIPNCKVQSNFTFSMAADGDPSTFTFTLDAFPGYTRFDEIHQVLAAIQVVEDPTFVVS